MVEKYELFSIKSGSARLTCTGILLQELFLDRNLSQRPGNVIRDGLLRDADARLVAEDWEGRGGA
jgi:hypothetical protein